MSALKTGGVTKNSSPQKNFSFNARNKERKKKLIPKPRKKLQIFGDKFLPRGKDAKKKFS